MVAVSTAGRKLQELAGPLAGLLRSTDLRAVVAVLVALATITRTDDASQAPKTALASLRLVVERAQGSGRTVDIAAAVRRDAATSPTIAETRLPGVAVIVALTARNLFARARNEGLVRGRTTPRSGFGAIGVLPARAVLLRRIRASSGEGWVDPTPDLLRAMHGAFGTLLVATWLTVVGQDRCALVTERSRAPVRYPGSLRVVRRRASKTKPEQPAIAGRSQTNR